MSLRNTLKFTQYRGHKLVTGPASEPVTAADLRAFLRESEASLPDTMANSFIEEARQYIEEVTGLAMINQTWAMALDHWPHGERNSIWWSGVRDGVISDLVAPSNLASVYLPRYPLSSVSSVTTYAENSDSTAIVVADTFDIDTYQKPGRMTLQSGQAWPVALRASNAIEIQYVAGYGATAADVPAALARSVMQLAAALYSNRGDGCGCGNVFASSGAAALAGAYGVARI